MSTLKQTAQSSGAGGHQVLDHRTLGRPVHLLGKFTALARDDLSQLLHEQLNRRYRAHFEIDSIELNAGGTAADAAPPGKSWLTLGGTNGRVNFALDRTLLLSILTYRYGTPVATTSSVTELVIGEPSPPATATEERLAGRLALQMAEVVVRRIEALQPDAEASGAPTQLLTEIASTALENAWTLHVRIAERTQGISGSLWLRLEESWITRLLRGLVPVRKHNVTKSGVTTSQPLPMRLQMSLTARLLRKEVTLGTLLDLRIGSVLPITVGPTDVLVGDSRLFTASVAEHHGKLCLTRFEDVE